MNQLPIIPLLDLTNDPEPYGNQLGKQVFRSIIDFVEEHPGHRIFGVSLAGIKRTDASFPRESVVSVAKQFRGEKCFFIQGFNTADLLDNWDYAAQAKEQNLIVWNHEFKVIGPKMTSDASTLLKHIIDNPETTTADVARRFDLTAQNASAKLKRLSDQGLIVRSERVAKSGGKEFVYDAPRPSD